MTPVAVLVLVTGVLVVLAVAGVALALDARRRRAAAPAPRPAPTPAGARQDEPIDTVRAQEDPPTVATHTDRDGPDLRKRQEPPGDGSQRADR